VEVIEMAMIGSNRFETVSPSASDTELARESSRQLATRKTGRQKGIRLQVLDENGKADTVVVPASALRLFQHLLVEMSLGNAVTLIPTHAELSTQQAADLLSVSRPYMAKLLDEGKIPGRTVGKFRRVRFDDLMNYKQKDDDARAKILDQLTAEAQELGLGY
jgi:excisionase family DNA binding protein